VGIPALVGAEITVVESAQVVAYGFAPLLAPVLVDVGTFPLAALVLPATAAPSLPLLRLVVWSGIARLSPGRHFAGVQSESGPGNNRYRRAGPVHAPAL
jgi:hypothetical protein